jgi:hypothetical protein
MADPDERNRAMHLIMQVVGIYVGWVYLFVNVIHRGFHALGLG